jgi:DNA helicase II / ATP-dependent DNA helicase PcrA
MEQGVMSVLDGLNPAQARAVQAIDGPVLVLAGPGSGKTRVLTHRIAYLIDVCGVRPYQILAVTFTNKAAREMIARLNALIGADTSQLTIGTFHAICARILRREGAHLGIASSFVIYDEDDQRRLVTRVLKELNLDNKTYAPSSVLGAISRAKNELQTAKTYQPATLWHEAVRRVFERYDQLKAESNALDFDDLLLKTEELLRTVDDVRQRYQRRYAHILVDEFQDTNRAQYELIRHLAGERRNVFVVGDEDQSIYSWRGADWRNVARFRSDYPDAQTHLLEQNYRSTRTILDAAQAVIAHNVQRTDKKLWTRNGRGESIRLFEAYEESQEAAYVVDEIERLIAQGEVRAGNCAVMFRTNAQSRALEEVLMRRTIPYRLVGGTRFYQRQEIKDVLAYLRVVYNPDDVVSLLRVISAPPRGIGARTVEQLGGWADAQGISMGAALLRLGTDQADGAKCTSFRAIGGRALNVLSAFGELLGELVAAKEDRDLSSLLQFVVERSGYIDHLRDGTEEGQDRINNVQELLTVTANYASMPPETALATFLEEVALVSDIDGLEEGQDAVTLLTLHTAKGLEYEAVFIVGMEEGICPHSRSMDDPNAMEEERRLCYVGMTRAKRHLYLLRTFRRTLYGNSEVREPSRFLADIPSELIEGNGVRRGLVARPDAATIAPRTREERRSLFSRRRARSDEARAQRRTIEGRGLTAGNGFQHDLPPPIEPSFSPRAGSRPAREATFTPGERVRHPIFGEGTVVASAVAGDDEEVTVAFEGRGVKRLMASIARLEHG